MPAWLARPFAAVLRVYEPSDHRFVGTSARTCPQQPLGRNSRSWAASLAECAPPLAHVSPNERTLELNGQTYVCPTSTPLQLWESWQRLRQQIPDQVLPSVVAPSQSEHIHASYQQWRGQHPQAHNHMCTAAWHAPLAWLALFSPADRGIALQPQPVLLYRARISTARRRLARAVRIMQASIDVPPVEGMEQVGQWLTHFHPRALVELDTQGLAALLPLPAWLGSEHQPAQPDSVELVEHMLVMLRSADEAGAKQLYTQACAPWEHLRARERAN